MADNPPQLDPETIDRMLNKLRGFVNALNHEERLALATLLGPGVAMAYRDDEVDGYGIEWSPRQLPDGLAEAIRTRRIEVVGLEAE